VFTRHSCFPDCKVPRVCLENLSETPTRGRTEESRRYDRLMKAVTKHANHDKNLIRDDLRYTLLYPDGTEVKTLPGSSDCVILHKYKDEIGKSLSRVTLYIATKSDVSDALFSELEEKCTASENIISRCRGGNCFRQIAASAEF